MRCVAVDERVDGEWQMASSKKSLFMGTTEVPAERSAGEIISALVQAGARNIGQEYAVGGAIVGVSFALTVRGTVYSYRLPVNVEPVFRRINGDRVHGRTVADNIKKDRETARRVAWRQVLRWVEAQLAMIQHGMVEADQVFLPYMESPDGKTFYEAFIEHGQRCLPSPEGDE